MKIANIDAEHGDRAGGSAGVVASAAAAVAVADHVADPDDAHVASGISLIDAGGYFGGAADLGDLTMLMPELYAWTDIEAALAELGAARSAEAALLGDLTMLMPELGDVIAERGVANGYAELDSGVLVPTARLGAGTADATKFLRGDRTWAVPPGGGGNDRLLASALVPSNSPSTVDPDPTTPTLVPGMTVTFTPAVVVTVVVKCYLEFTSAGGGSRFAIYLDGAKVWPAFGFESGWMVPSGDGTAYLWLAPVYVASLTAAAHTIDVRETASGSTAGKTYYGRTIEVWNLTVA